MAFPRLSNFLEYTKLDSEDYRVINYMTGEEWTVDKKTVRGLRRFDGTRSFQKCFPGCPPDEIQELYEEIEDKNLIRKNRFMPNGIGSGMATLWIPKEKYSKSILPAVLNGTLAAAWLPALIGGILLYLFVYMQMDTFFYADYSLFGFYAGLIVGVFCHEAAHACACAAYGAKVFEIGVMFYYFIPGAYTMADSESIRGKWKNIQFAAAGVEMNFLLVGINMTAAVTAGGLSSFFVNAAFANLILAIINVNIFPGLDGLAIIGRALGIPDLSGTSEKIFRHLKKMRKHGQRFKMKDWLLFSFAVSLYIFRIFFIGFIAFSILCLFDFG